MDFSKPPHGLVTPMTPLKNALPAEDELGRTSRVQIPVKTNCTPTQARRKPITRVRAGR